METSVVPANQTGTQIAKASDSKNNMLAPVDLNVPIDQIPDLDDATPAPFNLMTEYWTPENKGELRKMFFDRVEDIDYPNPTTGEVTSKTTVFFVEKRKTETGPILVSVSNASSRLASRMKQLADQGMLQWGTALFVTYMGKKKNSTNSFSSDDWDVKPAIIDVAASAESVKPE